jgi:hypothetical protein
VSGRIAIHILPDGRIQADVQGVKGPACADYIKILEELLDAETVDSAFKPEYFEDADVQVEDVQTRLVEHE